MNKEKEIVFTKPEIADDLIIISDNVLYALLGICEMRDKIEIEKLKAKMEDICLALCKIWNDIDEVVIGYTGENIRELKI